MEEKSKWELQELAEMECTGRMIKLVSSMVLATCIFFGFVFNPISNELSTGTAFTSLEIVIIALGLLMTQILVLGAYRDIKLDNGKYQLK